MYTYLHINNTNVCLSRLFILQIRLSENWTTFAPNYHVHVFHQTEGWANQQTEKRQNKVI